MRESESTKPADWRFGELVVPHPGGLEYVQYSTKRINFAILVVGGAADAVLEKRHKDTAAEDTQKVDYSSPHQPSFTYLPMRMGDIRGFQTALHFYGIRDDPELLERLRDFAEYAHGVLVAQASGQGISGNIAKAAELLNVRKLNVPTAVLGDAGLKAEWTARAGSEPVLHQVFSEEAVFPAVKALAKELLTNLKKRPATASSAKPWWKFW